MKLAVQIPALNEERTIGDVIARIPKDIPGTDEVVVIVVDDGSTDRTAEIAAGAGAVVVSHEQRRGVGAAFRSGVARAMDLGVDVIVTIDADGQFDPADISKVVQPILDGEADFVTASRFINKDFVPDMPWVKKWGNDFIARWISSMVKKRFYDVSCGFRAYSRNAFLRLVLLGEFTYTHEVFLNLAFAQVPIKEVPIRVRGTREHGSSRVAGNLFNYGRRTATIILKTYRDYRPLRFFSSLAVVCMLFSLIFLAFLVSVKIRTGMLSPHKWSGFVSGAFAALGIGLYLVGIVAEMLDRMRAAQDEILFRVRRMEGLIGEAESKKGRGAK